MKMVNAKTIKKEFGICSQTLNNWRRNNSIVYEKINSKHFIYDIESIKGDQKQRKNIIYCRVSNTKQSEDLYKQEQILREYCVKNGIKIHEIYSEIASGMNENRKKFNEMLTEVINGNISKIFISYKDRLTRFGFNYFEKLFEKFGCIIEVLNSTDEKTYEEELTEDLISIIHHFSMKMYSNRRKQFKEVEKILKNNENA
ncbi:MAG: IS607 family transposase [Patescibacteria group bacterium]|jgi:predicted site-specific integrase-resolvase